jgi:hypothetical protein
LAGIWGLLRRLGIVYRRARGYLYSPDPVYEAKLRTIASAVSQVRAEPQRYVLLYEDEMTYYRRPQLSQAYAPRGSKEPVAHLGYSKNQKRRIASTLDLLSGRLLSWQRSRFDRWTLWAFYRHVEQAYPAAERIFLVQDNWPVHLHADLRRWLQSSRLSLLLLPTYAPWTNPVEQVWRRLRQEVLHLHDWQDDWAGLQAQVQQWLDQWQDGSLDLLHYVGLYPY